MCAYRYICIEADVARGSLFDPSLTWVWENLTMVVVEVSYKEPQN